MCRVSSSPGLVALNPSNLILSSSGHDPSRIVPASVPASVQRASNQGRYRPAIVKRKSILRERTDDDCRCTPRLVSVNDDIALSRESSTESFKSSCTEIESESETKVCGVRFSNKVLVQEFRRLPGEETTWYTPEEMKTFQAEVGRLITQYERQQRCHWIGFLTRRKNRILHSHPALAATAEEDEEGDDAGHVHNQVKKILLVDSHDLSLSLLAKAFSLTFPCAVVVTACSGQDALVMCENHSYAFDLVVAEERLSLFCTGSQIDSGSALMRLLSKRMARSLFIGVSRSIHNNRDQANLMKSGADLCWIKPPPPLNKSTLDEIFKALRTKRSVNC